MQGLNVFVHVSRYGLAWWVFRQAIRVFSLRFPDTVYTVYGYPLYCVLSLSTRGGLGKEIKINSLHAQQFVDPSVIF